MININIKNEKMNYIKSEFILLQAMLLKML